MLAGAHDARVGGDSGTVRIAASAALALIAGAFAAHGKPQSSQQSLAGAGVSPSSPWHGIVGTLSASAAACAICIGRPCRASRSASSRRAQRVMQE